MLEIANDKQGSTLCDNDTIESCKKQTMVHVPLSANCPMRQCEMRGRVRAVRAVRSDITSARRASCHRL